MVRLMDTIIENHDPKYLEDTYENHFLFQNNDFSIMCESTQVPWLQLIPNKPLTDATYIGTIYQTLYKLGEHLKQDGFGTHFNVAKIGNKLPFYHIHLVMRSTDDEIWPEAIWCCNNLTQDNEIHLKLKAAVQSFFQKRLE